jgi:hypothetical protein
MTFVAGRLTPNGWQMLETEQLLVWKAERSLDQEESPYPRLYLSRDWPVFHCSLAPAFEF